MVAGGGGKTKESVYITVEALNVAQAAEAMKDLTGPLADMSKNIAALIEKQEKYTQEAAGINKAITAASKALATIDKPITAVSKALATIDKPTTEVSKALATIDKPITEASKALATIDKPIVRVRVDAVRAHNAFSDMNKGMSSWGWNINKTISDMTGLDEKVVALGTKMGTWVTLAVKSGKAAFDMAMEYAKAWEVQEKAESNLDQSLASVGMTAYADNLKQYASELQKVTTVGDEVTLGLMSQASAWAGTAENVKKATLAAINFEAAGGNAEEALKAMGNAATGRIESLKTLGVYLDADQKKNLAAMDEEKRKEAIISLVNEKYKEQAEYLANMPTGALAQVSNLWGDIREQIGEVIATPLTLFLQEARDTVDEILNYVTEWVNDADNLSRVSAACASVYVAIGSTAKAIWQTVRLVSGELSKIIGLIVRNNGLIAHYIAKPIAGVIKLVSNLVNKLPLVPENIKSGMAEATRAASSFFDDIGQDAINIGTNLKESGDDLIDSSIGKLANLSKDTNKEIDRIASRIETINDSRKKGKEAEEITRNIGKNVTYIKDEFADIVNMFSNWQMIDGNWWLKSLDDKRKQLVQVHEDQIAALEGIEGDPSVKASYRMQLEEDFQKQIQDIELENARETGNQQLIIARQYMDMERQAIDAARQQRLEADLAASNAKWQHELDKYNEQQAIEEQGRQNQLAYLNEVTGTVKGSLTDAFMSMFDMISGDVEDIRGNLFDMFNSMAQNLFRTSLDAIVNSIIKMSMESGASAAQTPVIGPALAIAAVSGTMALGMAIAKRNQKKKPQIQYATGGYISEGLVRGAGGSGDSVEALLQPGERVLSKAETKEYDKGRNSPANITVNVTINGQLSSQSQIRDTVRSVLIPEIRSAVKQGYSLGVA